MIQRIHHIAIVVSDLDAAIDSYQNQLGFELSKRLLIPEQEVEIAFLPAGESMIELIQPTTVSSGVAKYLANRGEGLHHICLAVANIEASLEALAARDVQLITPSPIQAAEGRGLFIHPHATHGVLIELLEADDPS